VFLDRDGVINRKLPPDHYVKSPDEFEFLPRAAEAMVALRDLGFLLVVVTNQRGIGRGLMTAQDLAEVHGFMVAQLRKAGVELEGLYVCPHLDEDACDCRKPEPGLLLTAAADLKISLASSFMVGDSPSDVEAGKRAGAISVRIAPEHDPNADLTFPGLWDFALHLRTASCAPLQRKPAYCAEKELIQ
jgi:histidinol-phosphate phosphatase family protein